MSTSYRLIVPVCTLLLAAPLACTVEIGDGDDSDGQGETSTDGDGDGDDSAGDGDGDDPATDSEGDGDGDDPATDSEGDGDGDDSAGDGDGDDSSTGDGDGDEPVACGEDPGWGTFGIGNPVKHIAAIDHTGEEANICEYAGTPMGLDIAALWCGPCHQVSEYLAGAGQDPFGFGQQLRDMIDAGTGKWITYIVEDANSGPASAADAAAWDGMYHHPNIPVMAEMDTQMLPGFFQVGCWPTVWVVGTDMTWAAGDDCATWNHLQTLLSQANGG